MTKQIIAAATIFAAGTTLSNAATFITSLTGDSANRGNYYGTCLKLTDTFLTTTSGSETSVTLPETVYLDSVTFTSRDTSTLTTDNVKLAIYQYSTDNTTGTFVALSDNSLTETSTSQELKFTFSSGTVTLTSSQQYQYMFVSSTATAETVGSFDGYKNYAKTLGLTIYNQSSLPSGDGLYRNNTINSWESSYMPKISIATSSIPEPSAFGLLAGLSAIALAVSRRRKR